MFIKVWIKAALAQASSGDFALKFTGLALAGGSVAFAAYMVANSGEGPRINGAEHLAIFAKPVSMPYAGAVARRPEFDMTPTGSVVRIRSAVPPAPAIPPEKIAAGYHMRGYSQGQALVQGPAGLINVKAGSEIEGLGRVTGIEARGRSLVIVTTGGLITGDD